jgi:hypothetical protein
MILIYGECGKNSVTAKQLYVARCPETILSHLNTYFLNLLKTSVKQEVLMHESKISVKLIWMKLLKLLFLGAAAYNSHLST